MVQGLGALPRDPTLAQLARAAAEETPGARSQTWLGGFRRFEINRLGKHGTVKLEIPPDFISYTMTSVKFQLPSCIADYGV